MFQIFAEALDSCIQSESDKAVECAITKVGADSLEKFDDEVWILYGSAKVTHEQHKEAAAIEIIGDALDIARKKRLDFETAELLRLRSLVYQSSFKNYEAIEDSYKAAQLYQKLGLTKKAAYVYLEIGNFQYNLDNFLQAKENCLEVIRLLRNTDRNHEDSLILMNAYNTLGLVSYQNASYDSAILYYDSSFKVAQQLNDEFWQNLVSGNSALIYFQEGLYGLAKEKFQADVRSSYQYHDTASACSSLISLGEIYLAENEYRKAKSFYDSALILVGKINYPTIERRYYESVWKWYQATNNHKLALDNYQQYIKIRDSIAVVQNVLQKERMQNERKFEKQLADIDLLKAENKLRGKELLISRISILAFVIILCLLLGLLYIIRKNNKRLNELNQELEYKVRNRTAKLKKINRELDTYLYRASHDVRRPILTILGLLKVADMIASESERHYIHGTIRETAHEMDKMLKKLQMAYELEHENEKRFTFNLNNYIASKVEEIKAEYPHSNFSINYQEEIIFKVNYSLVDIIFTNILENACIFSKEICNVNIQTHRREKTIHVTIGDNGIGIEAEYLSAIFDPYTRFSNKSTGSGLGLYLARKAVKKMGGDIKVQSAVAQGSSFLIVIPIKNGIHQPQNLVGEAI